MVLRGPGRKRGTGCYRQKSYLSLQVDGFHQMGRGILILMCRKLKSVAGRCSQLIHFISSYLLMVHEETTAKKGVMLSILFLVLTRKQASLANHSYPVGKSSFIANDKHLLTTQILTPDQP